MRHGQAGNSLNRRPSWRRATVRDIAKATLVHQRVCTTLAKAKEARKLVDQLITLGKKGQLVHHRRAFAILCDHQLVRELFMKISPRFQSRPGGYTRIIPIANGRRGDNAQLSYLELTQQDKVIISREKAEKPAKKKDTSALKKGAPSETAKGETPLGERAHGETPKGVATEIKPPAPEKPKAALPPTHPQEDKSGKGKWVPRKNIMSGFRNLFRKRPSE